MQKPPDKPFRPHGGTRGDNLNRRSSQAEGLFGRLFRSLPAAAWSEKALVNLAGDGIIADRMTAQPEQTQQTPVLPKAPREDIDEEGRPRSSRLHDDEENSGIDAGYTYLGQFIDHDITFDPASSLQQRNDVNALVDFRTPRFDLDSVYGRGPEDQPYMYDSSGRYFLLGDELLEGPGGKVIGYDLPRYSWTETTNNGAQRTFYRALIGDKRNDENVIISQLHGLFLRFHNQYAKENPELKFEEVQRRVRWTYQYVVLHDFLYKIAKKEIIEAILPHLTGGSIFVKKPQLEFYHPKNEAFIPVEFSAAAYRFGHSMVRPVYRLNTKLTGGNHPDSTIPDEKDRGIDGRQFIFAGLPDRGLNGFSKFPREWGIDWNLYFDLTGDKCSRFSVDRTQPSYKIDTSLVNPLAFLPEFSDVNATPPLDAISKLQAPPRPGQIANLALRNLLRGMAMSLPSGQDVALAMGLEPIKDCELKVGKASTAIDYDKLPSVADIITEHDGNEYREFVNKAPLWYYVLAESQHEWRNSIPECDTNGAAYPVRLGDVGSRIVVETFVGILLDDSHSILRQAPNWKPDIATRGEFDMTDFVRYAQKYLK